MRKSRQAPPVCPTARLPNRPSARLPVLLLAAALAAPLPPLAAQGERITLRAVPTPNQVIRLGMTQQLGFDVTSEMLPSAMRIEGRTWFQGIQRVGAADAQGRVTAQLSYDSVSIDLSMNGAPMPAAGEAVAQLRGKSFTIVYGPTASWWTSRCRVTRAGSPPPSRRCWEPWWERFPPRRWPSATR